MVKPILCSDKMCPSKNLCYRYIVDPIDELKTSHKIKVEHTLRGSLADETCSLFLPIKIPVTTSNTLSGLFQ